MTEQEWLACTDSRKMFKHFGGVHGKMRLDPRLRRFAVECCRRVRHLIIDDLFRRAADAGAAFADDPGNEKGTIRAMAEAAIKGWRHQRSYESSADRHQLHAARAALATCGPTAWHAAFNAMREAAQALNKANTNSCDLNELKYQADLLRCLFGPLLFRPIPVRSSWLTSNGQIVGNLAQGIYEERAFDRLPILADALEEVGCTNTDILAHCRQPGPHVRGCWPVALIFGRS